MKQITTLTNNSKQKITIVQENGEQFIFQLIYLPAQEIWIYNIEKDNFVAKGRTLVLGANIIRRFRRLINFGIACVSNDSIEPFHINDFTENRIKIYILTKEEVEQIERELYGLNS